MHSDEPTLHRTAIQPGRVSLLIRGAVQGVGFRPFVYRLASEMDLHGWVSNSAAGVILEAEAPIDRLRAFVQRLQDERPSPSVVQSVECTWLPHTGYTGFEIRESVEGGKRTTLVLPDLATCADCLREIRDPKDRRYRYPFTNCTQCGPRFTIIEGLPYDRVRTSMRAFEMCSLCRAEYEDPLNRRFDAQPNACHVCGPRVELRGQDGLPIREGQAALEDAAAAIRQGRIVAVKGLGGFHLMVAAHQDQEVTRLRQLKRREGKPFALLFPSLESIQGECEVSELEGALLRSPQAPIVLVRRLSKIQNPKSQVCPAVAPGNPYLGVMLPSTPLHHLLMELVGFPVVATSGNLSEEPICIDEEEAVERLNGVADLFLVHNRPIVRHADDSIARVIGGEPVLLRRARGYAPLPLTLPFIPNDGGQPPDRLPTILATGAQMKNCTALAIGHDVFVSQHIGDLETPQAYAAFRRVIDDFQSFYEVRPDLVAADAHPDYLSTRYARQTGVTVVPVQHHYAHVLACAAEHGLDAKDVLGVAWDGAGLGPDGSIWGGEFLTLTPASFCRFAHWRTFRLPGGDKAAREPRRSALGVLYEIFGDAVVEQLDLAPVRAFSGADLKTLLTMLRRPVNSPLTSSAGRLFDAVAALAGVRQAATFEGQAAMDLEFALDGLSGDETYALGPLEGGAAQTAGLGRPTADNAAVSLSDTWILNWEPVIRGLLDDLRKGLPAGMISLKVHNSLVEAMVLVALRAGKSDIVLSGGCFQNKYLTERAVARLERAGYRVHGHRQVPPNDGGIALGQVVAVRRGHRKQD